MDYPKLKRKDEDEAVIVLKELYRTYGYRPFKMRKFEEYDLYVENKNFLVSDDIITFSDFNGKLMALKPDVTLSIIKSVKPSEGTEKLFYHENVYRTLKNTREVREILQMGLECIGEVGVYETAEVLDLAAESLGRLTERYFVDISHMGFVNGLLSAAGLDFSQRAEIMKHLKEKNPHDLMRICREAGADDRIAAKLCRTASLWGSFEDVLPQLLRGGYEKAHLLSLMLVAGDHARNDMAGEGPESWKSRLQAKGIRVRCTLQGLGMLPTVQAMYAAHLRELLGKEHEL